MIRQTPVMEDCHVMEADLNRHINSAYALQGKFQCEF